MEIIYQQLLNKSAKGINLLLVELPYFIVPWHYHNEIEIIYIEKGHGLRFVGDHSEPFVEGDIALIGSNLPHVWRSDSIYKTLPNDINVRAYVIHFNTDLFNGNIALIPEMNAINNLLQEASRGVKFYGQTQQMLASIITPYINSHGISKVVGLLGMLEVMATTNEKELLASQGYSKIRKSADFDRFDKVHRFLIENFRNEIALNQVAEMAGMTPTSFCRYFKKRTTKSFLTFLNDLRLGHACKLLMENKLTIAGIATECGFNNLSNFNYLFKKAKGIPPGQYIRSRL